MPMPSLWSAMRLAWHRYWLTLAAITAPPPLPGHIRRDAILHCWGVGTVVVIEIDTTNGIALVRQPTGKPWVAAYSMLIEASRAEAYDFQAEVARRSPRRVAPKGCAEIIPFPNTPLDPSAA